MVSRELLNELRLIFKEAYGVKLKQNEAVEVGNTLVNYFSLLKQIETGNEEKYENLRGSNS